ncbi:hypothetical protein QVD17_26427 [Tagetes erecta]|uniref:Uncharacterized protein n=1 Tax=Tagetes erecta TaxID=13708 RepID=A0AAD8NQT7_TARER|nr:hypothetical protein QVD17_26427 [Tagetes erecta]
MRCFVSTLNPLNQVPDPRSCKKRPCEDLVNSTSATTAQMKRKRDASGQVIGKDFCAEKLSPASATATRLVWFGQVKGKHSCVESLTSASATTTEILYELFMEGGRLVAKIACRVYLEDNPHTPVTPEMPLMKGGIQPPPDPEYSFKGNPFYESAVASGISIFDLL